MITIDLEQHIAEDFIIVYSNSRQLQSKCFKLSCNQIQNKSGKKPQNHLPPKKEVD